MSEVWAAVLSAAITAVLGFFGVLVANHGQSKKLSLEWQKNAEMADQRIEAKIEKYTAVTDTKIEELSREIREHNQFAKRVPILETKMEMVERKVGI